jgi:DNA polymerase-1
MELEELQSVFDGLIRQHNLDLRIDDETFTPEGIWSCDVEHDEQGGFVGCGFYNGGASYYFSDLVLLNHIDFSALSLICHNGVSDFDCLRSWGINVNDNQLVWDTSLIAHINDSSRHGFGLKQLAKEDLDIEYPNYDDICGKRTKKQATERRTLDKWPINIVSAYNALDCYVTWKLYEKQIGKLVPGFSSTGCPSDYFEQIERPVAFILAAMEARGICVDLKYLESLKTTLELQKMPIEREIKNELGDINLNSPRQLLDSLNAKEIYPTFKGKSSTDKRALASVADNPTVSLLLKYSELDTLLSSFVNPYLERSKSIVHPWFNQCGTRTGRLSCSNPNLLQIPRKTENGKKVRRMFVPRPGMLMGDCDFGQIEPRVMAHLSKDPVLCRMFNDGIDFHTFTAERLGIERDRAKVLNLSVGYRASKYSVQRQLGGTLEEAQNQINAWWTLFPSLRRWQDKLLFDAKRSGFCTTLLGRRIKVDGLSDGNIWRRESAERQIINNISQGSAAEIMKMAMIGISKHKDRFSPSFGLLVQIYDELLFESSYIEHDSAAVQYEMENAIKLDVPLTVDVKTGTNWAEVH